MLSTALKAWLPDPALLAEEQNKQQTDPVSSHTTLGAALDFLLLSAPRLRLLFPPFFASFSETYPSSMAVLNLLLQNCTALSEEQVIYMLVPCPGCQGQLFCHDLSPQTLKLLQFSMTLHSLCWPSWFEKRGGGLSSSSPWCHSQHSIPKEMPQEHQHRVPKVPAETADVFWTQIEASPPASEDQDYEDVLEAHPTQLLLLGAALSVPEAPECPWRRKPWPRAVPAAAAEASPAQHRVRDAVTFTGQQTPGSCPWPVSSQGPPHALGPCWRCWRGFIWAGASQEGGRAGARGCRVTCGKHRAVPSREGRQDSGRADELVGPVQAVLGAVPAQPPGDAGAELEVHRAAAPPLLPTRGAGGHWEGQKTGN